jgi:hypothetical protein
MNAADVNHCTQAVRESVYVILVEHLGAEQAQRVADDAAGLVRQEIEAPDPRIPY